MIKNRQQDGGKKSTLLIAMGVAQPIIIIVPERHRVIPTHGNTNNNPNMYNCVC